MKREERPGRWTPTGRINPFPVSFLTWGKKRNLMMYPPYLVQLSCFFLIKQLFLPTLNKLVQVCLFFFCKNVKHDSHFFLFSNSVSRDQNECSSWAGFVLKALYTKPSLVMFFSFLRIRVSYCWVFRWILVSCLNPLSLYNISKLYLLIFYISQWLLFPLSDEQIFEAWELMIFYVDSDVNMVHIRLENTFFCVLGSQKCRVRKSKGSGITWNY